MARVLLLRAVMRPYAVARAAIFLLLAAQEPNADAALLAPSLTSAARSPSSIDLQWSDPNTSETGYAIERSLSGSSGFKQIASVASNTTAFQDTGLSAG